jgi:hypothetical protein
MNLTLTKKATEQKEAIETGEELEGSPFGGSDGFWYDITDGGYFRPEEAFECKETVEKIKDAVELLRQVEVVYNSLVPEF